MSLAIMRGSLIVLVVSLLFGLDVRVSAAAVPTVSVVSATQNVRPTLAVAGPAAASLQAARNEFESFQLVVKPGATPATITDVTVTALTGPGAVIPAGNITIYRAGEYTVAIRSDLEGATGRWFDALIPKVDPIYRETRNAFPHVVQANENANIWLDILVPANQAPGIYSGNVTVYTNAGNVSVPVSLEVLDFGIPSTTTLASLFLMGGYSDPCKAFTDNNNLMCNNNEDQRWALASMMGRVALENRVTLANPWPLGVNQAPPAGAATPGSARERWNRYALPLIGGTNPTPATGIWFPNRLAGARMTSVNVYWQCVGACVTAWKNEAATNGFGDRLLYYACDELPSGSCPDWNTFITRAQAANAQPPTVRTLITKDINAANANGATYLVDTIVPLILRVHDKPGQVFAGDQSPNYAAFAPPGHFWAYTSCMSFGCNDIDGAKISPYFNGWPGYAIDAPAAQHRAMGWLAFRYGFTGELYYAMAQKMATAWTDQYEVTVNGDGTLFYPGLTAQDNPGKCPAGTTNKACIGGTHQIPLESIRLKRIRDGYEDYELLSYLETRETQLGLPPQAPVIASTLFPTAYSVTVDKDGSRATAGTLEEARAQVIQRIKNLDDGSADLRVTQAGPSSAVVGSRVTFTGTVTNLGPSTIDVELVDTLEPSFANAVGIASQGNCGPPNAVPDIHCFLGPLLPGMSATVQVSVTPNQTGLKYNYFKAYPDAPPEDPIPGNNLASLSLTVCGSSLPYGDLNEDLVVNATDLVIMANYLVSNVAPGTPPFTAPLSVADLNSAGGVNATDLVLLANFLVGNISCLPV